MIAREEKSFLVAHWDWLVAGAGVLLAAGAACFYLSSAGKDPEQAAHEASYGLGAGKAETSVQPVDRTVYDAVMKNIETPATIVEPAETTGSYLASECRVFCEQGEMGQPKSCGLPIAFGVKVCPFCQAKQPEEVKIVLDSDGDGIPDEQEKAWGMNPKDPADFDADLDRDGFTNGEEFLAKTDPTDAKSHPSYLDSVRLVPPLKEALLPFYFEKVLKTPSGLKYYFKDPNKASSFDSRRKGETYSVFEGDEIGKTGFIVTGYEKKSEKRKVAGASGATSTREVDTSIATIQRKSDGKRLTLTVDERQRVAVDVQATLVFERNSTVKEFVVVPGDTVTLFDCAYKVASITRDNGTAKVSLTSEKNGKKIIEALEQ